MRDDWVEVEFNDVLEIISGKNQKQVVSHDGKYPIYGSGGIIGRAKEYLCQEGTTIIGRKGTINSPIFVKEQFWNVDTAFGLTAFSILDCRLLYFYAVLFNFKELDKSTTIPSLAKRDILKIKFPLPPRPEQRAIVAKIEALFTDLDKGIADLKAAQAQLKIYRQAVLKKAFSGELTSTKMGVRSLESLTVVITKGASPKWQGFDYTNDESELLFITSENIREGYISLKREKYLPVGFNQVQKRSVLEKGDVLFNIVGASIGRAAIFKLDKLSNINQAVALIRLNNEVFNQYVNYFLNSDCAKQEYLDKQVDVARANLSLQNVKDIEVPFCNEVEQKRVIREIESRLSVCDKVEQTIAESLEKAEALRQSILKKAFEGRLLSEEEIAACKAEKDYQPASALLAKINAEKNKSEKSNTGKSKAGKNKQ